MKQLAIDMLEYLAGDYPDFTSEHVEEVIRNVIASEGLRARQQAELREAVAELGF